MLSLYAIFHLNLAFSSIEEELRPEVVSRCYWPLLRLARELNIPLGIEASAYTLEVIESIDPEWLEELRALCAENCEFIASGYSQLIGPLVPAEVNEANLRIGLTSYKRFGLHPEIALVNEQAYSVGMVEHYVRAGFKAIVMEWDNPASDHQDWNREWGYFPQYTADNHGNRIPLIWNRAIVFQKFQRYAHGEMELSGMMGHIRGHNHAAQRFLPIYGNDAEIFDFRPGRFHTEAAISQESEWERIKALFRAVLTEPGMNMIKPIQLLDHFDDPNAGNLLHLESVSQPVPVKKQPKYNISRWALSGRNDLAINTQCWRIYRALMANQVADDDLWRELCYLWSSDFRTHITEKRWQEYLVRLHGFADEVSRSAGVNDDPAQSCVDYEFISDSNDKSLAYEYGAQSLQVNAAKGLTVQSYTNSNLSDVPLIKTLEHGYYDHIEFGADFYTGHFVFESPGRHKITDLAAKRHKVFSGMGGSRIRATYETPLGEVSKELFISPYVDELKIVYHFNWPSTPIGSLRVGNITLNPEAFDRSSLFVETYNGGYSPDSFTLGEFSVNHLMPVSSLVSSRQGLGVTNGEVVVGDASKCLVITIDKVLSAGIAHIHYVPFSNGTYFLRITFSLQEFDDTSKPQSERHTLDNVSAEITIRSTKTSEVERKGSNMRRGMGR